MFRSDIFSVFAPSQCSEKGNLLVVASSFCLSCSSILFSPFLLHIVTSLSPLHFVLNIFGTEMFLLGEEG